MLDQVTALVVDQSMGPSPVVLSKSQVVGNDVKSFVVTAVPEGSVVEKWDSPTNAWIDVSTKPASSNPRELMRLLAGRVIQEGDKLQWRPKPALEGLTQQAFEMIGWDPSSGSVAAIYVPADDPTAPAPDAPDNGSDGADWVAPVFTTSNQLPAGGTILALPIASTEIGVLRSFLQSVPGVSPSYIYASKGGLDFTLDVLEVPEGTSFYKALKIPPSGLFPQDDVLNTFAVSTNWYSSLEVAQAYADSPWGQSQGYQVVAFDAPKPLKLIDLGDDDTLGYVWAGLESDIRWTEAQLARLQGEDPPTTNPESIVVVTQQLAELRQDMAIVQLTTGYNASYATQLELLLQYGDAITNDFSYNPATEIENRGIAPGDTFIVEVAEIANTWQPATLVTGFATDPGGPVTWGGSVDDLNRISFTTAIDKELTSIIGTYLNVDGYYAGELPSLFHRDGRLIEEIALFIPRDSTAIVAQAA